MEEKMFEVDSKKLSLMELISDDCYKRIFNIKITSIELVALVGCSYERV